MSDIICVTNRKLCREDFLTRLGRIADEKPLMIILREKDLPEEEYRELAKKAQEICSSRGVPLVLHTFYDVAIELGVERIHMPLGVLREMPEEKKRYFTQIGASCHSVEDVFEAEKLGVTYVTAGHIFATDCKKGVPPRGTEFLEEVCRKASVPVYAIGGITEEKMPLIRNCGASGACMRSFFFSR
ncbi:MAG: thiamine phosphate synthase [Ruminococcus sp.]|nr:thiamine phosphate synthase [Ruminococcus sp.]